MRKVLLLICIICIFSMSACIPTIIEKCYEENSYDSGGKLTSTYKECATQRQQKLPITVKVVDK